MNIETLLLGRTTKVAIDAIYYVTRLIRHRADLRERGTHLLVEGLENEPSAEAAQLARNVVEVIENEEKVSLENISPEVAIDVVGKLEQLAKSMYSEGVTIDVARGDALLRELRGLSHL